MYNTDLIWCCLLFITAPDFSNILPWQFLFLCPFLSPLTLFRGVGFFLLPLLIPLLFTGSLLGHNRLPFQVSGVEWGEGSWHRPHSWVRILWGAHSLLVLRYIFFRHILNFFFFHTIFFYWRILFSKLPFGPFYLFILICSWVKTAIPDSSHTPQRMSRPGQ